ncbi:uncharacterized protein LOC131853679 [Achroia grisella]|uniref:uncharacterized protein LOC131853679 n=1 Tax=Achroia grisella TaxID=688607 RepID=UPI0027D2324A|nr:uncharacterized protein LOC131853679 [Achroia grisella]
MDQINLNDWLGYKNEADDDSRKVVNMVRSLHWREQGTNPRHCLANKTVLENIAENILVQKALKIRSCDLPGYPRSTFLMVFSPDGTKVASTHGNHNVYVSELASGRHVRILKGHPRTPWCIAFHPSHPQLIGSGCLGGQVRVWDIASGGSEVWNVQNETVIASIAFHPRDQLLVIATHNELYFWDWSQPAPFTKVSTNNVNEKVRYVAFDALGYKLITGISLWVNPGGGGNLLAQQNQPPGPATNTNSNRRDDADDNSSGSRGQESPGTAQDLIVNSYQNLVQRYDSLVRNYQRLFRVRHRLVNTNTPTPPNTMDRGTDPMETDMSAGMSSWTRSPRPSTSSSYNEGSTAHPIPARPHRQENGDSSGESSGSRLLNLDVLSINSNPTRNQHLSSNQEHSTFGSRSSAFQPLGDTRRTFRSNDPHELNSTRLLLNPFSSSNNSPRPNRNPSDSLSQLYRNIGNASRTSIFTSSRPDSERTNLVRDFARLRRNSSPSQATRMPPRYNAPNFTDESPSTSAGRASTSANSQRPTMTSTSTQMSPITAPVDAQSINESLDLIRDILRDSGTRLLNLITNMSLTTLESVERSMPRRGAARAQSDDGDTARPRLRLFRSSPRRDLLTSSSDSDSDLEVNIFRTRNSSFREDDARGEEAPSAATTIRPTDNRPAATDRMVFELNNDLPEEESSRDAGGFNVSVSRCRFRVRTHDDFLEAGPSTSNNRSGTESANVRTGNETSNIRTGTETFNVRCGPETSVIRNRTDNTNVRSSTDNFNMRNTTETTNVRNMAEMRNITSDTETSNVRRENETSNNTNDTAASGSRETNNFGFNPNRPSTSRDSTNWPRGSVIPPDEAYRKVKGGVKALQKHTLQLTNMWLRGNRTTMRELRVMWENLRRRVLMLHRETGRQDSPSYYTRSLLERCMMLTEMSDNITLNTNRGSRSNQRNDNNNRSTGVSRDESVSADNTRTNTSQSEPSTSTGAHTDVRQPRSGRSPSARTSSSFRSSPSMRRRLQSSYRWRPEDELRRRSRNPTANRLAARYSRCRRDYPRAIEISATRHEIHMRAMQVLSVMFNMMMMCLEERGLSQLIIDMLRTLKKALALTCLMLMTNRNNGRSGNNPMTSTQPVNSLNVVRIQNVDHTGPVNVDGPDDPASPHVANDGEEDRSQIQTDENKQSSYETPSTSHSTAIDNNNIQEDSPTPSQSASQRWSNRLAVQIAAANRNNSATARNRRELYLESRRLKALHRTNPTAHPLIKKRALPPVSTYRIPALRSLPSRLKEPSLFTPRRRPGPSNNEEPVAGPSNAPSETSSAPRPGNVEAMNEFEHRVNLIRIAHMQAVNFRNAARNRFRRLQTIRLYTPSSVREMFALSSNNSENQQSNQSPLQNASEHGNRRTFATYRPHILTPRSESVGTPIDDDLHTIFNNINLPLMQVNEQPTSSESQGSPQSQRLPRIHEYLQPIILAQNAMVMDVEGGGADGNGAGPSGSGSGGGGGGGGGGVGAGAAAGAMRRMSGIAGLLDAGIISEPAPSHRVQAWDFTTGTTPDIADSEKNVVVPRCKIHNDASIDISKDGRLLVALLPLPRFRSTNQWLGVYSLEWARLGQCLHTAALEQSAVSVALSPTARHLVVGLGSRRITTTPHSRNNVFALLYKLYPKGNTSRTSLLPIKELEQNWEHSFTSLNCIRWAPQPGQGLVYANNTGQLIIMS